MSVASQRGFGLIEILITLVVIAFGIMAHLTFQRVTFHEAGLAVSRAKAAEAVQEKLEDLISFGCLKTGDCAFAYQDIANDAGGNIDGSSQLILPADTAFTIDNTSYTRHWTVTNYWYTATNGAPTTITPADAPLPDLKAITVKITWTDTNGDEQSLNLSTIIAGANPADAARVYQ